MGGTNFLVSIQRQDHQGWQGTIQWLDTGKILHFRSELEMLLLMEEATKKCNVDDDKRSWLDNNNIRVLNASL